VIYQLCPYCYRRVKQLAKDPRRHA
jgi:hypothetical protein